MEDIHYPYKKWAEDLQHTYLVETKGFTTKEVIEIWKAYSEESWSTGWIDPEAIGADEIARVFDKLRKAQTHTCPKCGLIFND